MLIQIIEDDRALSEVYDGLRGEGGVQKVHAGITDIGCESPGRKRV